MIEDVHIMLHTEAMFGHLDYTLGKPKNHEQSSLEIRRQSGWCDFEYNWKLYLTACTEQNSDSGWVNGTDSVPRCSEFPSSIYELLPACEVVTHFPTLARGLSWETHHTFVFWHRNSPISVSSTSKCRPELCFGKRLAIWYVQGLWFSSTARTPIFCHC